MRQFVLGLCIDKVNIKNLLLVQKKILVPKSILEFMNYSCLVIKNNISNNLLCVSAVMPKFPKE